MSTEVMCDIQFWATVASPIIGAVAIIVALCVSRRSSKDAQRQIDVFMAAQAPEMLAAKEQYEKQLQQLDKEIAVAREKLSMVDPFPGRGPRIDQIDKEAEKQGQRNHIRSLQKQRDQIATRIQLIESFLEKQ